MRTSGLFRGLTFRVFTGVVVLCGGAVLSSCTTETNEDSAAPSSEDVSVSDVALVKRFALEELDAIARDVEAAHPELTRESADFRKAFLKRLAADRTDDSSLKLRSYYIPGTGVILTNAEAALLARYPWNIGSTRSAADEALQWAQSWYPGSQYQTEADAFRHAFWVILMARRIGLWWATAYSTAHESESSGIDRDMDMNNNKVGQNIYSASPVSSELQLASNAYWYPKKLVTTTAQISTTHLVHLK